MTVAFGSDHAGFHLREALILVAEANNHHVIRYGATGDSPYDYPDASDGVARSVLSGEAVQGVLICGTGIGVSIRANRYIGIRAAVCCSVETAELARAHNHANVLCLGARTTPVDLATSILLAFWESPEDHDERHDRRVRKLDGNVAYE